MELIIRIEADSSISLLKESTYEGMGGFFPSNYSLDSLTNVFDSERIITFCSRYYSASSTDGQYNLLYYNCYSISTCHFKREIVSPEGSREEYIFTYTFTEEDYEFATPLVELK